ncbi:hypothetical protein DFS33DRAFT_206486 [Desarmillaria ectypa]|nr:hypothetical protein DFS33DRAFT_206486 [Desarmillaria ectypa]
MIRSALKHIRLLAPSSSRKCYFASRGIDTKVSIVPSNEERKAEYIRISKRIQARSQRGEETKAPLRVEELNTKYWETFSGPGWSGAHTRLDEDQHSHFYELSLEDRKRTNTPVRRLIEITDAVLFCTAPENEIELEELGSATVDWDDLESGISQGSTHRPAAVTATVEAMLQSASVDDAFLPTDDLEKILSDTFSNITLMIDFTTANLPFEKVEFEGITEVTLRDRLRGRNLATVSLLYGRAGSLTVGIQKRIRSFELR